MDWAHSGRLFYSGDRRMLANKLRPNYDAMLESGYCLDAPNEIPAGSVEYVVWNQETHGSRVTYTWRMPLFWKAA